LTVSENVAIPLVIQGYDLDAAKGKALQVLDHVHLKKYGDFRPQNLSGGQQQRVAIARALIHDPKIIVCDEPTSALDSANGRNVMQILKNLARDNDRTLIVVTHDSRVYSFADRIAEMEDGIVHKIYHTTGS
ncbi:MAG: ATP-binding cassette domain-containing protein, partial [Alphaproteobacteria bacterium]|nr:ATP-binding cassette domain-containing protein [Alphaproteobacteria bacterium]